MRKSRGRTVDQLLDEAFAGFGYFEEKNGSLYLKARKAQTNRAFCSNPMPQTAGGDCRDQKSSASPISRSKPSATFEGDVIQKQKMSIFE